MKLNVQSRKGFSIVEMIIATVLVISLSAVSYNVLKTLTLKQSTNVAGQKTSKAAQIAIDRFKNDMSMVDYNWVRYGVTSIYPHPGFGFDTNYYLDPTIRNVENVNDGVTFLRRDPANDKIYGFDNHKRLCFPAALTSADWDLYSSSIAMPDTTGLNQDDWVLIYQAGKYALGTIAQVNSTGVIVVPPQSTTLQRTALNNGVSTGMVGRAGVVAANMDFDGTVTATSLDDSFCFDVNAPKLQKIANPVSYFVDYRTTDGEEKNSSNSYVLEKSGRPQKMLVRVEYHRAATKREYIASVNQVEFSYDLLQDDPTLSGNVLRDVGHERDNHMLLLLSNSDPTGNDMIYETTSKVIAVKMNLVVANDGKETGEKEWTQSQELKVALDPSLKEDMYQDLMEVTSSVTENLNTIPKQKYGKTYDQQLGKPLYISNGAGEQIMVPVSTFELIDNGNGGFDMGIGSEGSVYVYNAQDGITGIPVGCAVNSSNCDATEGRSAISFGMDSGKIFFPNVINQITLNDGSGTTRIVIGGVGVDGANGVTRLPAMAIIDLPPNKTVGNLLEAPITVTPGGCNIPNCVVQTIDNTATGLEDLVDTANVAVDQSKGDIYVATMTKKDSQGGTSGGQDPSKIYKGTWNGSGFDYSYFSDVPDTSDGRIVSAVGDRLVEAGGNKYIVTCLTKKIDASCNGECLVDTIPGSEDQSGGDPMGRIELIKNNTTKIMLMKHNYRCSSLTIDNDNNIIVGGRLTAQTIPNQSIRNALSDTQYLADMQKQILYLDEIGIVKNQQAYFADYFKVDENTYPDHSDPGFQGPQDIGWLTGLSAIQFPDGTYGIANANKYRLDDGAKSVGTTNRSGAPKEYSNAGIMKVSLAGMQDRVVATIETNLTNINASVITATYNPAITEIPPTYLPGKFWAYGTQGGTRTTPTPLPSASLAMSDQSWIDLFRQMISSTGVQGLNQGMPMIGPAGSMTEFSNCKFTAPRTCQ